MQVTLITPENQHHFYQDLEDVFRLRHRIFNEWLEWDLPHANGQEFDKFDGHSLHLCARDGQRNLIGYWRLTPTTKPYLAAEAFSELLAEIGPISDPGVWELSRGCIDKDLIGTNRNLRREVIASLISSMFEFAIVNGISEFLSVQSRYVTRLANRALGDPIWKSHTINAGATDATCYSYAPSLERLYALRTQFNLAAPVLRQFNVTDMPVAAE